MVGEAGPSWKITDVCERVWAACTVELSWLSQWTSYVGVATFEKGAPAAMCACVHVTPPTYVNFPDLCSNNLYS